jgi:hypothetical protein
LSHFPSNVLLSVLTHHRTLVVNVN